VSSWKSVQMTGSDAGQGSASEEEQRQGLLSSLKGPGQAWPVQHVSWLEPINDHRLVQESIANWNCTRLHASLWQQQEGCRQATIPQPGRQNMHCRPSLGSSWLVKQNYYFTKAMPHRPSTSNGQFVLKLSKSCCVHFQVWKFMKIVKTFHQFQLWTTALA